MEIVWILSGLSLLVAASTIPAIRYQKRTGKKLGRGGAAAGLHAINEIFHPSAANASVILEEQKEARVAIPSPEDKDFERMINEYISGKNKSESA